MRLRLSSDSSFLLSTYVFAMAAAANLYFYFWYQQLKLIYVAFLRQDHRAKCETISLFPLTTNNSIAEKGFLSSVNRGYPYPFALFTFSKTCFHFQNGFRNKLSFSKYSSFLKCAFIFKMRKILWVAFLRQDHRAKCETISLFPLTTNNSIAEKGFLPSVKQIPYPSVLPFWSESCTGTPLIRRFLLGRISN